MGIFNKVPLEKVIPHMQASGKRELVWFGVTVGQVGFGIIASVKRQPTKRAADACPACGYALVDGVCNNGGCAQWQVRR